MTTIKEPNIAGWERDVAKHGMRLLCDDGYHPLLTIPHNDPQPKFEKIKGKSPGYMKHDGLWAPAAGWKDASKKPDPVEAFKTVGRKTRFVPNIGVLCGLPIEIGDKHVGYLTAIDVDTACPHVLAAFSEMFGFGNPVRRGRRGGTFLCITDQRESKDFKRRPDAEGYIDDSEDENGVQFISGDKQTVVLGVHPKTLKRFNWETAPMSGEPEPAAMLPITQLPVVSTAQLDEVLSSLGFERGKGAKATAEERTALSKREKEIIADLKKTGPLDFEEVDEELGITALLETDAPLRAKLTVPYEAIDNHNGNDMAACELLRLQLGEKFDHHVARAVLAHFPACSAEEKQNERFVARIMSKVEREKPYSDGNAFDLVNVDEAAEYIAAFRERGVSKTFGEFKAWCERVVEWPAKSGNKKPHPILIAIIREAEINAEAAELAERERVLTADIAVSKSSEPASPKADKAEDLKPAEKRREKGPLNARGGDLWQQFNPPDWAVYGMLPQVGTAILYGDSNVGKTFLGLHLLDRVSRGATFCGRRTRASDTLYVSSEGGGGLSLRLKALYDAEPFEKVSDTIMVRSDLPEFDKSPDNAAKKIKLMALEAKKESGRDVGVIVLDNWALMLGDRDENDNSFTAAVLKALSKVADELGCLFVILHHTNKDQKSYRGSSSMRAAVDGMYSVKVVGRFCEVECSKLRDGPKPPKFSYRLKTVEVGVNEHGDKVTSCIVLDHTDHGEAMGPVVDEASDDATLTPTDTPADKMAGVLRALTTCIRTLADTTGDDPSEVGASANKVFLQLAKDREAAGLPELKDRTAVPRFLAKLIDAGKIIRTGINKRLTEYRLAD